ncbi:hypothetical protein N7454_002889 [Penicillium verhagenii]|nr:hypothetical protein N7454_002889 [Penicillium verhagenii]
MKVTNIALAGAAIGLSTASPVSKRAISDADILNYALTLEHLEATFYQEGLQNYTQADFVNAGFADPFYANLKEVASDELTHETFLSQALTAAGASPVARCNYSFPSTDVNTFLAVASILEGVGVSAYLGAASSIMNATYLTAAGSILTVEARHSAYLRAALGKVPFPQPFDDPLDFNEVYTVASPFITSCPSSNGKLPVMAFPSLTMSGTNTLMSGSTVQLVTGSGFNTSNTSNLYAAFITVTGPLWAPLTSTGSGMFNVTIPTGIAGQSYVVLTKGNTSATDDNIVAGPAIVEIGMATGGNMTMPSMTPSMTGAMSSTSATAPASSSPLYNAAVGKMTGNIFGVLGAGIMVIAALA